MPYIGNTIRAADDYRLIDDISSGFNGSATSFALQVAGSAPVPFPKSPQQVLISVNGVIQEPDPTGASGFNLVGTNIVFSSAPTNGHAFFGIIYATADYLNSGGNFPTGSLGAPSITFVGDEDTGIYRKGSGSVGFVSNSTEIANTDSNGITISSGNLIIPDKIIHNGDTNPAIRFPAADTVTIETSGVEGFRVSSNSIVQTTQANSVIGAIIKNTTHDSQLQILASASNKNSVIFFGDAADDDIGQIDYDHNDNSLSFVTNTTKCLFLDSSGNLKPGADSTFDIGSNSNRFANGYFDTLHGNGSNLTGVNSDVVDDTSPQLGGDLDTNGNNIIFDDNDQLRFGNATGGDIVIAHKTSDNNGHIENHTGDLLISTKGAGDDVIIEAVDDIKIQPQGGEDGIKVIGDGAVELYHNNVKTVETSGSHLLVFGNNNGNHGGIKVRNTNTNAHSRAEIRLEAENAASFATIFCDHQNTNLRLGYNSTGTTVDINGSGDIFTGNVIPTANNSKNLGNASFRWANIFTMDLQLSNKGSSNDVDQTWGDYTIQEGFEDLFLINNRTGKKFKFNLTEVV